MTDRIEVVSAAIIRRGEDGIKRLLLGQRQPGSSYPYRYVTPGGKIDPGELAFEALARELSEEVGLILDPLRDLRAARVVYEHEMVSSTTGKPARVTCYALWAPEGFKAQALDGLIGIGWFSREDLIYARLGPADEANREPLRDLVFSV